MRWYRVVVTDFSTKSRGRRAQLLNYQELPFSSPLLLQPSSFSARAKFIRHSWWEVQTGEIKVRLEVSKFEGQYYSATSSATQFFALCMYSHCKTNQVTCMCVLMLLPLSTHGIGFVCHQHKNCHISRHLSNSYV